MLYISISYSYSPDFNTPESWFKRTAGYAGIFECMAKENKVISVKQINYEGIASHNGVDYHFVNLNRNKTHFPFRINRYIKSLNPDVVIIQGLHNPIQLIHLHSILPKKTKIIAHHHAEKPLPGMKKYRQRWADRYVDAYLFASMDMGLEWVTKGNISSAKKLHEVMEVSSNFSPVDKASAKQKTGVTGNPAFLWVGRLNDNKDPLNVVLAFLKYLKINQGASLYMIYHTDELLSEINSLLENDPNGKSIITVGKVPHADLLYWYNSADFLISGSHYEGSGTAVCEAMSCGCVPIVTDIFSFRMITDNGNCGLLYKVGDEFALLEILRELESLDIKQKQELCLKYFKEKLSFEAIARQIDKIGRQIVS
ncbi:MAG: glycosyltransferase [Bacteroidota bacterium]|nr:glycosyltransferase [Bacteroidota bacterium]